MDLASHRALFMTFARGGKTLLGIHLLFSIAAGTLAAPLAAATLQGAVLRISLRFIVRLALWSLPAAGLLGAIYLGLPGEHDINFYLAENPPAFRWAVGLAALVLTGHLIVVARVATGWVHALPLAIFRGESPNTALRLSREAPTGQRKTVFYGLITDDPAMARRVLAERAAASFGEKLLLDLAGILGRKPPTPEQ